MNYANCSHIIKTELPQSRAVYIKSQPTKAQLKTVCCRDDTSAKMTDQGGYVAISFNLALTTD